MSPGDPAPEATPPALAALPADVGDLTLLAARLRDRPRGPVGRGALFQPHAASATAGSLVAGDAAAKLDVVQWRDRFSMDEQDAFELAGMRTDATGARMRTIKANLEARGQTGRGVDPTSAKTGAMTQMLVDAGVVTAARRLAILAPVGTYPGEPGYTPAPVAPPDPPA